MDAKKPESIYSDPSQGTTIASSLGPTRRWNNNGTTTWNQWYVASCWSTKIKITYEVLDFTERWVVNDNWTYTADLTPFTRELNSAPSSTILLVFYGIDTIANIVRTCVSCDLFSPYLLHRASVDTPLHGSTINFANTFSTYRIFSHRLEMTTI